MIKEDIKQSIERYLKVKYAKTIDKALDNEIFNALSLTLMES